ncbi:MAG: metallophosphoesterase family protein, partial [Planctomycetota bacterium]
TKKRYYSFDTGGFHFVVLDGNDVKKENRAPGYPRFIGAEQLDWLKADLESTDNFTFLFSHQSLENTRSIENNAEVRVALEDANKAAGFQKVVASFSGHHHIDFVKTINNIHYIQINIISYKWVGENHINGWVRNIGMHDSARKSKKPIPGLVIPYHTKIRCLPLSLLLPTAS